MCCVVYDSCAQQYAHKYEQVLNLCLLRFRLVFVRFCKGLVFLIFVFCVSLHHFGRVLSKLFLLSLFFSVLSQEIVWGERLRNDLFCVELDVVLNQS